MSEATARQDLAEMGELSFSTDELEARASVHEITTTRFRQLVKNERNRRTREARRASSPSVAPEVPERPPAPATAGLPAQEPSGPGESEHESPADEGGLLPSRGPDDDRPPSEPSRPPDSGEPVPVRDVQPAVHPAPEDGNVQEAPPEELRVHLWPVVRGVDDGQGGVRRVAEGMQKHLPKYGIRLVNAPEDAQVIATHIQIPQGWEKRFRDATFVAHCHGLYWEEVPDWADWTHEANHLVLRAIKTAHASTVPTEWVSMAVRRHTGRVPLVVPHGIDADEWDPNQEKPGYVYWDKTRPDPVCDPSHVNTLAKLLPDVPFVSTFGDATIPNLRVTGKVSFEEAKAAMEQASVYLATPRETFGVSILQAWAAAVPVVGWRWGGQAEIVEEGKTGFLVRPYDWDALARAVKLALERGPGMRKDLLEAARRFSWDVPARMYADLYRQAYAARHRSPRTSIIVTAHKLAQYLPACLDSVLGLVDQDWECIIVDDASPDACGEIADRYAAKDPRFRVIHNATNLYLAGARNEGLRIARGRYVMALDADDMLPPHATNLLADALDEDLTTHVAYGAVYFVGEDGRTPMVYGKAWSPGHSGWPIDFSWELQLRGEVIDAEGNKHVAPNCLPYSSMMRIEAARNLGGWRERCRTAEDADFWARLSSYGYRPRRVTDADTLIYRVREGSMSQSHARVDHTLWFGWRRADLGLAPAGVDMGLQPRVPSLDPPGISVIIPVGPGHERIAQQAVDSLEAQTWRGWEAILVNDTGEPLPPIYPSWVRHVETKPGKLGPAHARNLGALYARAKLLFWLDADDFLQPEGLRTFFEAYTEAADWDQVYFSDFFEDAQMPEEWTVYECPDWEPARLLTDGMIGAVTMLVPKLVHSRIDGFDETVRGWEDYAYQLALATHGICSTRIAQPLWTYRKHTGMRREANQAEFEDGKRDMIAKFPQLWQADGRVTREARGIIDVACASCRKGREARLSGSVSAQKAVEQKAREAAASGLVPIIYQGDKTATHRYRSSRTNQTYRFANGMWAYVHPSDVDWLLSFPGFSIYKGEEQQVVTRRVPALR